MTTIRVQVTAEHIAACAVVDDIGDGFRSTHPDHKEPVELAIAAVVGRDVMLDEDGPGESIATFGQGQTTIVLSLPSEVGAWTDRYYKGEAVEPFAFDMVIEDWLVALVARPTAWVGLAEAAQELGTKRGTLQHAALYRRDGLAPNGLAARLDMRKVGRDWLVPVDRLSAEIARRRAAQQ